MKLSAWDAYNAKLLITAIIEYICIYIYIPVLLLLLLFARIFNEPRNEGSLSLSPTLWKFIACSFINTVEDFPRL